jgi:hypothetical protein
VLRYSGVFRSDCPVSLAVDPRLSTGNGPVRQAFQVFIRTDRWHVAVRQENPTYFSRRLGAMRWASWSL